MVNLRVSHNLIEIPSILKLNLKILLAHFLGTKKEKTSLKESAKDRPQWVIGVPQQNSPQPLFHPIYERLPQTILPGKYDQVDALYEGLASIHTSDGSKKSEPFIRSFINLLSNLPFRFQPINSLRRDTIVIPFVML